MRCRGSRRRAPSPWRASRLTEAEAALLERAAGQQRVARAAQPVGARLVALLERAHRLLVQGLDLVQRAAARRVGGGPQRGVEVAQRARSTAAISRSSASRVRAKAASTSRVAPRAPSARAAPRGRPAGRASESPSASRARACAGSTRVSARPRHQHGPRDPEVRVRRADLRVVRDLGRARRRRRPWGASGPGPAAAAGRRGSSRRARASTQPRRPPSTGMRRSGPAHLDDAVVRCPARGARRPSDEQVQEARPHRHLLVVARRRAARCPTSSASREVGEPSPTSRDEHREP